MKTVKELHDRVREEFEIVARLKAKADINVAMMNVDKLLESVRAEEQLRSETRQKTALQQLKAEIADLATRLDYVMGVINRCDADDIISKLQQLSAV